DRAQLDAFVRQVKGTILGDDSLPPPPPGVATRAMNTGATQYLVRVDPSRFPLGSFLVDAAATGIGGAVIISDDAAARLLALTTHARAGGVHVTPNFVAESAYLGSTQEDPDGKGGYTDAFAVPQFASTGSRSNVLRAWQLVAAKPPPRRS